MYKILGNLQHPSLTLTNIRLDMGHCQIVLRSLKKPPIRLVLTSFYRR